MATLARRKAQQAQAKKNLWRWGAVALAVLIGLGALWWWQQSAPTASYPAEISVAEAATKRASGVFILDVRQPDEWNASHIPGSTLIPLDTLAARISELPTDQEIVVVCRSGNRSASGRDILRAAGFTQVTSMAGGLQQWQAAGYPTASGP